MEDECQMLFLNAFLVHLCFSAMSMYDYMYDCMTVCMCELLLLYIIKLPGAYALKCNEEGRQALN